MGKGKNVLTTGEVARLCNVAARTVSKWFDSGKLRGYRIPGSRDRRIPAAELSRFMKQYNIPMPEKGTNSIRILLVGHGFDRNDNIAATLQEQGGYEVQTVTNAFQAGVTLARFAPHVIVINVLESELDALALHNAILKDVESQGVRILAVAEHVSASRAAQLIQHGFDDCVTSLNVYELIACIEQVTAVIY